MAAFLELVGAVGVLLTSVVLASSFSPKSWLLVDSFLALAFATFEMCCAGSYLSLQLTWNLNGYHFVFVRGAAVMMAVPSMVAFLTKESSDAKIFKGLLLSRIIGSGTRLVLVTWSHFTSKGIFLDAHLYLIILSVLAWFLVSAIQYWKFHETPEKPAPPLSTVDYWLLADAFWSFLGWAPDIVCPSSPLGHLESLKIDFLHLHLFRLYGAMNLGSCVVSLAATRFKNMEDKSAVFKSRIIGSSVIFIWLTSAWVNGGIGPSITEYLINIGAVGPLLIGIGGLWAVNSMGSAKAGGKLE